MAPTTTGSGASNEQFEALWAAISGRRSIKLFAPTPVPRALLERLLEGAVWAPNHRLTEPWRFYVLDGASRQHLGAIAADITRGKTLAAGATEQAAERKAAEAAAGWSSVPALLFVTVVGDHNPEVDQENYGAACCAVQNVMLLAHGAGLGTSWSSGAVAAAAELKALVGAGEAERLVALLRIGYPDVGAATPGGKRASAAGLTRWVDR